MLKTIKKIGDSRGIILSVEQAKIYDLHIGDIVEVEIKKVRNKNTESD